MNMVALTLGVSTLDRDSLLAVYRAPEHRNSKHIHHSYVHAQLQSTHTLPAVSMTHWHGLIQSLHEGLILPPHVAVLVIEYPGMFTGVPQSDWDRAWCYTRTAVRSLRLDWQVHSLRAEDLAGDWDILCRELSGTGWALSPHCEALHRVWRSHAGARPWERALNDAKQSGPGPASVQ